VKIPNDFFKVGLFIVDEDLPEGELSGVSSERIEKFSERFIQNHQ
jgi:hypothetical protein